MANARERLMARLAEDNPYTECTQVGALLALEAAAEIAGPMFEGDDAADAIRALAEEIRSAQ